MADWYIEYADVAVGADKATTITATDVAPFSNLARVPFGAQDEAYITLELNNWVLDGTYSPLPVESNVLGYWTDTLTDENGDFDTHPILTATLNDLFSSTGIQLVFSDKMNDFSSSLNIKWYRDETLLADTGFEPDKSTYLCREQVESYNKVIVDFASTAKPYRRLKLAELAYGYFLRFEPEDCLSIKILQELSPLATALPESKLSFEINTRENVSFMFQEKQPVRVYLDNEIVGAFFIKSSKQTSKHRYSIEAEDAIGVLSDIPYTETMYETATNAKTVVEGIVGNEFIVSWSAELDTETIKGLVSAKNTREAIQQICFAIGAVCHTDFSNGLIIEKLHSDTAINIPQERIYEGNSVERIAALTSLNVYAHTYTETQETGGTDVIKVGNTYYQHSTTITTINNPNIAASAKRNVFEIKEATLVNTDNVAGIAQRVYDYLGKTSTHSLQFKRALSTERLGAYVSALTPFDVQAEGFLEYAEIQLSGIVAIQGKYVYGS